MLLNLCLISNSNNRWWLVLLLATLATSQAQPNCTFDENCNSNEFCKIDEGYCETCFNCELYNRHTLNVQCVRTIISDCGDCIEGFEEDGPLLSDTALRSEFCKASVTGPGPIPEVVPHVTYFKEELTSTSIVTQAGESFKPTSIQQQNISGVNITYKNLGEDFDESDKNRPWIYVGIAFTLFLTFGTCGVVGFKYYVLPIQLERRRKMREMNRNKMDTLDIAKATLEEKMPLYNEPFRSVDAAKYIGISPRITLKHSKPDHYDSY